jgi:Tol biopolymer transport system component
VLVKIAETDRDVWTFDLKRETLSRLQSGGAAETWFPIWTPDGSEVIFGSQTRGSMRIFRRAADGTGDQIAVTPEGANPGAPQAITTKFLVSRRGPPPFQLWIHPLEGRLDPRPLFQSQFNQTHARISPNERWIAYQSDETGRYEVYVRPFPDVAKGRWQVSSTGGQSPVWSRDGRELVFLSRAALQSVAVRAPAGADFSFDRPRTWFDAAPYVSPGVEFFYDISADGTRLLLVKPAQAAARLSVNIVTNWIDEVRTQAGAPVR